MSGPRSTFKGLVLPKTYLQPVSKADCEKWLGEARGKFEAEQKAAEEKMADLVQDRDRLSEELKKLDTPERRGQLKKAVQQFCGEKHFKKEEFAGISERDRVFSVEDRSADDLELFEGFKKAEFQSIESLKAAVFQVFGKLPYGVTSPHGDTVLYAIFKADEYEKKKTELQVVESAIILELKKEPEKKYSEARKKEEIKKHFTTQLNEKLQKKLRCMPCSSLLFSDVINCKGGAVTAVDDQYHDKVTEELKGFISDGFLAHKIKFQETLTQHTVNVKAISDYIDTDYLKTPAPSALKEVKESKAAPPPEIKKPEPKPLSEESQKQGLTRQQDELKFSVSPETKQNAELTPLDPEWDKLLKRKPRQPTFKGLVHPGIYQSTITPADCENWLGEAREGFEREEKEDKEKLAKLMESKTQLEGQLMALDTAEKRKELAAAVRVFRSEKCFEESKRTRGKDGISEIKYVPCSAKDLGILAEFEDETAEFASIADLVSAAIIPDYYGKIIIRTETAKKRLNEIFSEYLNIKSQLDIASDSSQFKNKRQPIIYSEAGKKEKIRKHFITQLNQKLQEKLLSMPCRSEGFKKIINCEDQYTVTAVDDEYHDKVAGVLKVYVSNRFSEAERAVFQALLEQHDLNVREITRYINDDYPKPLAQPGPEEVKKREAVPHPDQDRLDPGSGQGSAVAGEQEAKQSSLHAELTPLDPEWAKLLKKRPRQRFAGLKLELDQNFGEEQCWALYRQAVTAASGMPGVLCDNIKDYFIQFFNANHLKPSLSDTLSKGLSVSDFQSIDLNVYEGNVRYDIEVKRKLDNMSMTATLKENVNRVFTTHEENIKRVCQFIDSVHKIKTPKEKLIARLQMEQNDFKQRRRKKGRTIITQDMRENTLRNLIEDINKVEESTSPYNDKKYQDALFTLISNAFTNKNLEKYSDWSRRGIRIVNFFGSLFLFPASLVKSAHHRKWESAFFSRHGKLYDAVQDLKKEMIQSNPELGRKLKKG